MPIEYNSTKDGRKELEKASFSLTFQLPSMFTEQMAQTIVFNAVWRAPVRTGYLQSTIDSVKKDEGWAVEARAFYAGFVEYGTSRMQPRPFMEPAIEAALKDSQKIFVDMVKTNFTVPNYQMLWTIRADEARAAKDELDLYVKQMKQGIVDGTDLELYASKYQNALIKVSVGERQAKQEFAMSNPALFQMTNVFNKFGMASSTFFQLFNTFNINTIRNLLLGDLGVHNMQQEQNVLAESIDNMQGALGYSATDIRLLQAKQQFVAGQNQLFEAQRQATQDQITTIASMSVGVLSTFSMVQYTIDGLEAAVAFWMSRSAIAKMRAELKTKPTLPEVPPDKDPLANLKDYINKETKLGKGALDSGLKQVALNEAQAIKKINRNPGLLDNIKKIVGKKGDISIFDKTTTAKPDISKSGEPKFGKPKASQPSTEKPTIKDENILSKAKEIEKMPGEVSATGAERTGFDLLELIGKVPIVGGALAKVLPVVEKVAAKAAPPIMGFVAGMTIMQGIKENKPVGNIAVDVAEALTGFTPPVVQAIHDTLTYGLGPVGPGRHSYAIMPVFKSMPSGHKTTVNVQVKGHVVVAANTQKAMAAALGRIAAAAKAATQTAVHAQAAKAGGVSGGRIKSTVHAQKRT